MNRLDDIRLHNLIDCLLNKACFIPTYADIDYAEGLILEAVRVNPEDDNLKKNASIYSDVLGKAYLFLILNDKMYGEPKTNIHSTYGQRVDDRDYESCKAAKNSLYGKYASNQLDDEVPEGFHRTPFGLMPNCLFHPDNDYLKEDASREQIIEFANATADDVEQLKDFIYNDEDPEGYSHYKLVKETAQRVFDLNLKLEGYTEEYDATLKAHGDTLEEHLDRICELEHMYKSIIEDICAVKQRLCNITSLITEKDKYAHIFDNFCGNCTHCDHGKQGDDEVYVCELSGEIVDPDSATCSMFGPPF
jgi:hypothetical protein